jgi:hypothetical protein
MDTCLTPQSTGLFGKLIIELEGFDSGMSASSQANDDGAIIAPPKMS